MDKCRMRDLTVRASGSSDRNVVPIAPLQFESPVGQLLAQILQTHPHLLPAAIDQQLENIQIDKNVQREDTSQDLLYQPYGGGSGDRSNKLETATVAFWIT
ncbi:hypothetical protein CISIN_1g034247mg [Citrus sinensis]|uniref:Uncharacterized protein n=1 Tax=Citrus sinensis TaxID=2711 RepID=A0A067D0A5_CITSI|nr:hypothetical protein CISIN_1g034247mg [Citrus sinensis]